MPSLPDPTFVFTIPSLHDGTLLDCRIYVPGLSSNLYSASRSNPSSASNVTEPWQHKAAVLAHPYAPLGGCCDDPVVGAVGSGLLAGGWVVGVFNFRGASTSPGRTSWTGKPELADYVSFAGLVALYMDFVRAPTSPTTLASPRTAEGAAPAPPEEAAAENAPIRLILGGYSYGSLIASRLPSPPSALLAPFLAPAPASPAAAIVTRARDLAARTTAELLRGCEEVVVRKRGLGAVVVGGDADAYAGANANATAEGSKTAASRPSRKSGSGSRPRSLDLKNAVGRRLRRYSLGKHPSSPTTTTTTTTTTPLTTTLPHINITTAFLLLSPLLPPTSLAIAPGFPRFRPTDSPALLGTPGLAVYGDRDVFTSAERLAGWVGALRAAGGSKGGEGEGRVGEGDWGREGLEGKLIKGAGHFWIERGVLVQLVRVVGAWAGGLEG